MRSRKPRARHDTALRRYRQRSRFFSSPVGERDAEVHTHPFALKDTAA